MRLVRVDALTPGEIGAWADLAGRAAEPNPFFEPGFVRAAAESPNADSPMLLVHEEDGEWISCMPVRVVRILGRRMALTTWKHLYSFMGSPLVDRASVARFVEALVEQLMGWRQSRFLVIRQALDDSILQTLREAILDSGALRVLFEHRIERAAVTRRADPDAYLAHLKQRRRREMERRHERLEEAIGAELEVTDQSADPAAFDRFLELEASGWKGAERTAMASCGDADVFRAICGAFARKGRLQLLVLEAAGRPLAMQCNMRAGDTLFSFKVAYDERLKRYAPGVELEVESIRIFHRERDERVLDSCADPGNELLNRLYPDTRSLSTLAVGPSGASGKAVGRLLQAIGSSGGQTAH
jgi:CelD/BcsL family acetyltransferase involved in cellulose biosynthesis